MSGDRSRFRPASLRWRLLGLVTVATLIVWVMAGVLSYQQSGRELRELLDTQMDKSARMLLAQAQFNEHRLDNLLANMNALRGPRVHRDELPVEFQIGRADGSLLVRSPNAPATPLAGDIGFSELVVGGWGWRSLTLSTVDGDYRIQVLQSTRKRDRQVLEMASQAVIPLFVLFPLLLSLIFVSVRRGLEPLDQLAIDVSTRSLDNLAPVTADAAPLEARPLVDALNDLLRRLARTLENERRFTADAAHELRTPLAVVKVQAQVALGSGDGAGREHALQQVVAGTDRATHLVEQLLRMARLDPLASLPDPQPTELAELARQVVAEQYAAQPEAALRLRVALADGPTVSASRELLAAALRNLLDNALRYTPAGSSIEVFLRDDDGIVLGVADAGEGVSPEALARLGERFYRGEGESGGMPNGDHATKPAGSGLGLAIVQRIAELHGARLVLRNREAGGFEASIRWPPRAS